MRIINGSSSHFSKLMERMYRLVDADKYLVEFASERKHMLEDGQWIAPPPDWPLIQNGGNSQKCKSER
jgi:N-terminal glutamine amidase